MNPTDLYSTCHCNQTQDFYWTRANFTVFEQKGERLPDELVAKAADNNIVSCILYR